MSPVLKRILQMRVILLSRFAAPGNLQARLISGEQLGIALAIRLPDTSAIGAPGQYVRPRMRRARGAINLFGTCTAKMTLRISDLENLARLRNLP
jgi:hypothetical protein